MCQRSLTAILEVQFPETFFPCAFRGPACRNDWQMFHVKITSHVGGRIPQEQIKIFRKNVRKSLYKNRGLFILIFFLTGPDDTGAKIILVLAFGISANIIHSLVLEL